jgi:glycosyltransferase involved in cell wall biosynthesis
MRLPLDRDKLTEHPVVLAFLAHYLPGYKAGGPIRTMANLVDILGESFQFKIFTSDRDFQDTHPYRGVRENEWNRVGNAMIYYCSPGALWPFTVYGILSETEYDILYLNSFFSPKFTILPLLLRWFGLVPRKPTILAPRGELAPAALKLKAWKKKPYMLAARRLGLHRGLTWRATTLNEKNDILDNFTNAKRMMAAGRIHVAENLPAVRRDIPVRTNRKEPGRLNMIFLSRICRMKNLELALDVLNEVKGHVSLHIYGPVEDVDYWKRCQRMFRKLPGNVEVSYLGTVKNSEVMDILGKYDLFFLPTLGENFGHVIWEAMMAGCPVLISDRTPWRGLPELGIGWDLPLSDIAGFRRIIENCAGMDQEEHFSWSMRARNYALSKMLSEEAVERNIDIFRAALSSGG